MLHFCAVMTQKGGANRALNLFEVGGRKKQPIDPRRPAHLGFREFSISFNFARVRRRRVSQRIPSRRHRVAPPMATAVHTEFMKFASMLWAAIEPVPPAGKDGRLGEDHRQGRNQNQI